MTGLQPYNNDSRTGVLLLNLGTPDSPKPSDVRKYLLEFLTDKRVIDLPWLQRNLLVRGIIVPFRYRQSAKLYGEIWDEEQGSPLMFHSRQLAASVAAALPGYFQVELAMRYREPSIQRAMEKLHAAGVERILVLPLFPQYASSTTGTAMEKVMEVASRWNGMPSISFIPPFYNDEGFISAFAEKIGHYDPEQYDHVLFSYHGLPERHLRKAEGTKGYCLQKDHTCCNSVCASNSACYRAHCHATTTSLVERLGIGRDKYTMCFQSRLGRDPWIQPYTSDVLEALAASGARRVLVACPAFVADCLETIHEIGVEYQEEFAHAGGEKVQLAESLNASGTWVQAVADMILRAAGATR